MTAFQNWFCDWNMLSIWKVINQKHQEFSKLREEVRKSRVKLVSSQAVLGNAHPTVIILQILHMWVDLQSKIAINAINKYCRIIFCMCKAQISALLTKHMYILHHHSNYSFQIAVLHHLESTLNPVYRDLYQNACIPFICVCREWVTGFLGGHILSLQSVF